MRIRSCNVDNVLIFYCLSNNEVKIYGWQPKNCWRNEREGINQLLWWINVVIKIFFFCHDGRVNWLKIVQDENDVFIKSMQKLDDISELYIVKFPDSIFNDIVS